MASMYGGSALLSAGSTSLPPKPQTLAPISCSAASSSLSCSAATAAPRAALSSRIVSVSRSMEMAMPPPYGATASGLSSRSYGVPRKLGTKDLYDSNLR
ncbi:hypothetical protein EUGRSUZ_L03604 [Eucalyptus grandis]|uniref:Uncharacterized protein n=1 Tax=Eucalyptus grandis TaxID=71139 RepID=A0AAD9T8F7_EUCGR|nr:hypothetical protein EUGRSUZ_L03604 [Eucalyptus grandis]